MLCDVLERAPDSDAWVYENQRASYSQLEDRVSCLAHGLTIHGVEAGDRVGVVLANRPEFLEVILATARIGAIAVPINVREQTAVKAFCAARLAEYKILDYVTFVSTPLPRNANGKLLKAELRNRVEAQTP